MDIISKITIPGNFINLTPDISPSPTLKKCTEEIDLDQFLAFLTPQILPQIYPLGGQTDSLGRVVDKQGTINGKKYKYHVYTFDHLGRPTFYKEVHGKTTAKHYGILYDSLGRVTEEYVKVSAKSGSVPWKSKTKILTL